MRRSCVQGTSEKEPGRCSGAPTSEEASSCRVSSGGIGTAKCTIDIQLYPDVETKQLWNSCVQGEAAMTAQMKRRRPPAWPGSNPVFRGLVGFSGESEGNSRRRFAEDDDDFREAVSGELADYGFDVIPFADGKVRARCFPSRGSMPIAFCSTGGALSVYRASTCCQSFSIRASSCRSSSRPVAHYLPTKREAFDRGALDFVDKSRGVPILAQRLRLIADSHKKSADPEFEVTSTAAGCC